MNTNAQLEQLAPPESSPEFMEAIKPTMRANIRNFVSESVADSNVKGPYVDVACGYRTNEPEVRRAKNGDLASQYLALDLAVLDFDQKPDIGSAPNIAGSAEAIPLPTSYAETVLCTEALEHVENDVLVLSELRRILRPNGTLILTVPGKDVPLHEKHYQRDYRRYTEDGLRTLLEISKFANIRIETKYLEGKEINIFVVAS
jgi:SAM-dependent methyltransferase